MTVQVGGSLRQVGQRVHDLDRAVEFYRDTLGLPFVAQFGHLAFFDLGGVRLLLERGDASETSPLYLGVDDVHDARRELEQRGVVFHDETHIVFRDHDGVFGAPGDNEWLTFFHDSEGNLLALSARQPSAPATASHADR